MLHFYVCHCKFDDAEETDVRGVDNVCNVSVREDVSWLKTEDCGLRLACIRTAQPENLGRLAFREVREEIGVVLCGLGSPLLVVFEALLESVVCTSKSAME